MSRLDELPPDQHAALSLLLRQRKSYAEVAALLGIPERAVHDRAHAALAVLAPRQARELTAERREEIGDYLLGQQASVAERLATRTYLDGSAPGRAWAQAISARARSAGDGAAARHPRRAPPRPPDRAGRRTPRRRSRRRPGAEAELARRVAGDAAARCRARGSAARCCSPRSSSVIVAVILLTGGGGSSHSPTRPPAHLPPPATAEHADRADGATGPPKTSALALHLARPEQARRSASSEVLSEGGKHAFYLAAEHLPPSHGFFYAVWLYNSPTSAVALSKSPAGRLQPAPAGRRAAARQRRRVPRRCCSPARPANSPPIPGPVVLRGAVQLADGRSERQQLARVHDPGGIELGLQRAQRRQALLCRPPRSIHGAWSRPTAWWWVIVPPLAHDRVGSPLP